jgi:hypothetical protein
MESTRFDRLIRIFSQHVTRRTALGFLSALGLADVLTPEAEGKKRRRKCKRCGPCRRCKRGRCKPKANGTACGACATCQDGQCEAGCPGELSCQNNVCGCPPGQKICGDECIAETQCCGDCPQGQTCCENVGECKDLRNDDDFCGQCANGQCPGGAFCANGACGLTCNVIGEICFQPSCFCSDRVDPAHDGQNVCAEINPFNCNNVTECETDADCAPATEGFRQVCVSGICPDKQVCASPCA